MNNPLNILKQITYKQRAIEIIDSCICLEHFEVAKRYVKNYYNVTEDFLGYQELLAYIREQQTKSLYPA